MESRCIMGHLSVLTCQVRVPWRAGALWVTSLYLLARYGYHRIEEPDGHLSVVDVKELLIKLHCVEAAKAQAERTATGTLFTIWE
jgi:hypothetical protein